MIKWKVTLESESIEFAIEKQADDFILTNGGSKETIDEYTGLSYDQKREIQTKLLEAAWQFITPYFDQPAFIQMTDWKSNLPKDHAIQLLIESIQKWKDAVMVEYLMKKKPYLWYGYPYDFDYSFIGEPPCSFTDMFLLLNPTLQPANWVVPDVSEYIPGKR